MRLLETTRAVAVAATQEQLSPPPAATTRHPVCDPHVHDCRWWPYSNSGEFGANAAMVVVILLCALICALALNAAVRCFLRATTTRRGPSSGSHHVQGRKPSVEMVYSSSSGMMMKLNECPICLSEFVEGEGVRVLERCKHGFHARCIDTWLSGHSSCPTCRATCFALPPSSS